MIDEQIQAPAAEGVADFTTPVGREDHVRDVLGADRSKLRYRDLKVRQDFEQKCLEAVVGTIDLVDQQDGRALAPCDRAEQRTLEQVLAAEDERFDFGCAAPVVLGKPGAQHLPRVVPFVERRVDVEPFVALQANELGVGKPRHYFRELGFPAAGLALDEQRLSHFTRQVRCRCDGFVGHVAELFHRALEGEDVGIHVALPDDGRNITVGSGQEAFAAAAAAEVVGSAGVLGAMARRCDLHGHAADGIALLVCGRRARCLRCRLVLPARAARGRFPRGC